ncbi:predicted protein, partial [Arabidopsis lyrata subsp. lyrata]
RIARAAESTSSSPSVASGDRALIHDDEFTQAKVRKSITWLVVNVFYVRKTLTCTYQPVLNGFT